MQQSAAQLLGGRNEVVWADPTLISPLPLGLSFARILPANNADWADSAGYADWQALCRL